MIAGLAGRLIYDDAFEPLHRLRVHRSDLPRISTHVPDRVEVGGVATAAPAVQQMQMDQEARGPARLVQTVTGDEIRYVPAALHVPIPVCLWFGGTPVAASGPGGAALLD